MDPFRRTINYLGAIPKDHISRAIHQNNNLDEFSLIYNTDNSDQPGEHWKAIYSDGASLEYYDPLDDGIEQDVEDTLRGFITSHYNFHVVFKQNKVK